MSYAEEERNRALAAAELCLDQVEALIIDARESYEIYMGFYYLDGESVMLSEFDPFLKTTIDAHLLRVIISLYILGDKESDNLGVFFLRRKLEGAGLLEGKAAIYYDKCLQSSDTLREKVRNIRNKHFAHRDKKHTYGSIMQQQGLSLQEINTLITHYYQMAQHAATSLGARFYPEKMIETSIKESIADVRQALLKDHVAVFEKNSKRFGI